jgi:hypothetical protein
VKASLAAKTGELLSSRVRHDELRSADDAVGDVSPESLLDVDPDHRGALGRASNGSGCQTDTAIVAEADARPDS